MKAWFARRYGGPEVLRLEEAPKPVPKPGEILVKVHATTVNSGDRRIRACDFPPGMKTLGRLALGWNRPRQPILGTELAGVVEAIGQGVTKFSPGEAVYAFPGGKMGAHAEYVVLKQDGPVAVIPQGVDMQTAAALCFGGSTALTYLRRGGVEAGQSMLVLGGSGAVGSAMVQLGKLKGAEITATTSAGNLDLVRSLGADTVIDYHSTDVSGLAERFDVIADTVGAMDFATAQKLLRPNGRYLAIAGAMKEMLGSLRKGPEGKRMIAGPADERLEDIVELGRLAASAHYRPPIDQIYDWADMPAAHAQADTGRKRGSVVVQVAQ
ncbi:NAD(P)-dependent alcohol dehydrogenase [uncultured Devosia sp.]|uniref:NAD(P)-dependent alcohol dehydrogenase n=1 Tax=uncultured Devosia sp. TaxID=211434 RepID=UPI00261EE46A|nr:NAD(P)-dependent alcohol dehydrogenase [uncultured Devosia sp.]